MKEIAIIILAAGQGKRMQSSQVKVLHRVAGKPLLFYPLKIARAIKPQKLLVVVGHQQEKVQEAFPDPDITYVTQSRQLGTGHAAATTRAILGGFCGDILLLCGDIPLIKKTTVDALWAKHREGNNSVTLLTTAMEHPTGYGRIVRDSDGTILRIVEEKDASPREKEISEINAGIYCFDAAFLFDALHSLSRRNAQKEYYLTDTVAIARDQGGEVTSLFLADNNEVMGINNRVELARAGEITRKDILERLMLEGVTIINPRDTYIEYDVRVGRDTVIYPNTFIEGATEIGEHCLIESGCRIRDSTIESYATIKWASVISESIIHHRASIGPFAHIRPGSEIGEDARIGNFVEVKKSSLGKGSKASHLSYLGDSTVGSEVNVGAGTITCNYDGIAKHQTIIEDGAFIGSNTELVAPVRVGRNALIGAGSTITRNVPPGALAVGRGKQVNYNNHPFMQKKARKEAK